MTIDDIDLYLCEIKEYIKKGRYRIERNSKRQDNINLFDSYVIDEEDVKEILLDLQPNDFSEKLNNKHKGFEHEKLYVFGKDVELLERYGNSKKKVSLYIKLNKINHGYVIVVSLHEQKYPMKYYFK